MKKFVRFQSLAELRDGDIVQGLLTGTAYVVCGNYGDHVTAVRVQDITQPSEWSVLREEADPIRSAVNEVLDPVADAATDFAHTLAKGETKGLDDLGAKERQLLERHTAEWHERLKPHRDAIRESEQITRADLDIIVRSSEADGD